MLGAARPVSKCDRRADPFLIALLVIAAILVLWRLDDAYLWQDEAETALVARHLLQFGLPLSSDGRVWVQQSGAPFVEFTRNHVWIYHSWLQYALAALSFAVLGFSTVAARLPFALVGLATIAALYGFARRWMRDQRIARIATALLVFNVPFVLLQRQCRYYGLAALFTLLTVDAYLRLRQGRTWAVAYLVLASVLLYHSHYGAFFPTLVALGLHTLMSRPERRVWGQGLTAAGVVAALTVPWAIFMQVSNRGQPWQMDRFVAHIGQDLLYLTGWVVPLPFLGLMAVLWFDWLPRRYGWLLSARQKDLLLLSGLLTGSTVLVLSGTAAFDWAFFRYLVQLVPILMIVLAALIVWVMNHWPTVAYALLILLVTSNLLHVAPYAVVAQAFSTHTSSGDRLDLSQLRPGVEGFRALDEVWTRASRFRSDLWMYLQELTHDYVGPNEGLVAYLSTRSSPGQTLAVNYEDLPLGFYTDLRVVGGLGQHGLTSGSSPDWVVIRRHGPYRDLLEGIVARGPYIREELPYPDIRWENRPEPGSHQYLTPQGQGPVVIYWRREP